MAKQSTNYWLGWSVVAMFLALDSHAADPLREGFVDPPDSARPRVWWHWLNGNITQDGVAKDLSWLKSVGVGGVQNFDANLGTPQIIERRLAYMQPEWQRAFRFAVEQADRLGLEFAIAASPGWSVTGGPWVPAADGLKKVVWSETTVAGGRRFVGRLAAPPQTTGPFQDIPLRDELAAMEGKQSNEPPRFYGDIAVYAVPVVEQTAVAVAEIRTNAGASLDAALLADHRYGETVSVPRSIDATPVVITLSYPRERVVSSFTLHLEGGAPMFGDPEFRPILEARIGDRWQTVARVPIAKVPTTVSLPPTTALQFRLVMAPNDQPERVLLGEAVAGAVPFTLFATNKESPLKISELRLDEAPRIDRFEAKAGFALVRDYYALDDGGGEAQVTPISQVIDLTARMRSDGSLDWVPPPGQWRVIRMGYSLLGTTNHPASPEATGLEVDKFDGAAVRRYLTTYLRQYRDAVGDALIGRRGLGALLTDSIEVGAANWTPQLLAKFQALRGYDPRPWLPALTGVLIESRARSEAFLYDYRRTLAELMSSEHYGTIAAVAREHGLISYGEALEDVRPSLGDDMDMRSHADIPMAALWAWQRGFAPRSTLLGDMKGASSVAHVFGKPYVAAESMTAFQSPWAFAPSDLRRIIDLEFAHGINRPVIHTSVHQPLDDRKPGLSLAIFGQYFTRHETWAPLARPWIDYIARSSYLLQQGRNVADVAYFYGEEQPLTALYAKEPLQGVPVRHAFDFVNASIVARHLEVDRGDLVTPGGARYRALYLGGTSHRMTLPILNRIAQLANAGATIIGAAPKASPALGDDQAAFHALVERLWSAERVTRVGKGRVIAERDIEAALATAGIAPDFEIAGAARASEVLFVHRRTDDADIYFVNNRRQEPATLEARFRVVGRKPEIWRADTGRMEAASYRADARTTVVTLEFGPEDSFFVVFREPSTETAATVAKRSWQPIATLSGAWDVSFESGRGAPERARFPVLTPLNAHPDVGIRYFSGLATYRQSFVLPRTVVPGEQLILDLGGVGDVAEVRLNGALIGTTWWAPFKVDIGAATRAGKNDLEVRVANLWVNRLIGDQQPGAQQLTFTTVPTYQPDAPLRASGLLGPVRLLRPVLIP